jgi:hypothetical protein
MLQSRLEWTFAFLLFTDISTLMEALLKNSIAPRFSFVGSVWRGIAFLRTLVEIQIQMRDSMSGGALSAKRERWRSDPSSPHQFVEVVPTGNYLNLDFYWATIRRRPKARIEL